MELDCMELARGENMLEGSPSSFHEFDEDFPVPADFVPNRSFPLACKGDPTISRETNPGSNAQNRSHSFNKHVPSSISKEIFEITPTASSSELTPEITPYYQTQMSIIERDAAPSTSAPIGRTEAIDQKFSKRQRSTVEYDEVAEIVLIHPEHYQGRFYLVWVMTFVVTSVMTGLSIWFDVGDLVLNDNIIYNTIGANNICVLFDYAPAIFITPFFSCFLSIFGTFYIMRYFGIHYSTGLISYLAFDYVLIPGNSSVIFRWMGFLDIGFTILFFFGHSLSLLFLRDAGKSIALNVALKEGHTDRRFFVCSCKGIAQKWNARMEEAIKRTESSIIELSSDIRRVAEASSGVASNIHTVEKASEKYYTEQNQTYIIIPEFFQSYFYGALFLVMLLSFFITFFGSDFDKDDNPIRDRLGFNSIIVFFNYSPSIYITPLFSCILTIFATGYIMTYYTRIWMLFKRGQHLEEAGVTLSEDDMISPTEHWWLFTSMIFEWFTLAWFTVVFAINDESPMWQITAYFQAVFFQILFGWRNIYYLQNYGMLPEYKRQILNFWGFCFSIGGAIYLFGLVLQAYLNVQCADWWLNIMHVLEIFILIFFIVPHIFMGCFVGDNGKCLRLTITLKDAKDSQRSSQTMWDVFMYGIRPTQQTTSVFVATSS